MPDRTDIDALYPIEPLYTMRADFTDAALSGFADYIVEEKSDRHSDIEAITDFAFAQNVLLDEKTSALAAASARIADLEKQMAALTPKPVPVTPKPTPPAPAVRRESREAPVGRTVSALTDGIGRFAAAEMDIHRQLRDAIASGKDMAEAAARSSVVYSMAHEAERAGAQIRAMMKETEARAADMRRMAEDAEMRAARMQAFSDAAYRAVGFKPTKP